MPTKVLVFESDAAFADELREGLSRLDCSVTVVDDATLGLQTALRDRPDLILLAIELPRMNGFSVCNKLKRDPGLKDVPLIIMSSESSDETFEQHRRLRTRAEDYVHKPLSFSDLVARTQPFIKLGSASVAPISNDAIVIEDDLQIEDDDAVEILDTDSVEFADAELELETSKLTEQAFDSILDLSRAAPQSQEPGLNLGEGDVHAPPLPSFTEDTDVSEVDELEIAEAEVHSEQPEDIALNSVFPSESFEALPEPSPQSVPPPLPSSLLPRGPSFAPRPISMPARVSDTDAQRFKDEVERHRARSAQLEEEARAAQARITELEDAQRRGSSKDHEVQRLQRELDEVKSRAAASKAPGAGSAREFLDLREQLNKKDKELLDLRDQLTHRDKELVILRDGAIDLERQRADLHDQIADVEKQLSELTKTNDVFRTDKEAASKRADDFKRKADKLKTELDAKTAESQELKTQLDAELIARGSREAEFEARAQTDLEKAVLATEASERERAQQALEAARAEAQQALEAALAREQSEASSRASQALAAREAELVEAHGTRVDALERGGEETLRRLRAEHEQALIDAENAGNLRLSELRAELEGTRSRELEALRKEHAAAQEEREVAHAAALSERNESVSRLERDLASRTSERDESRRDLEKRKLRVEGLETDLAQTREDFEITQATLTARERSLETTAAALAQKSNEAADLGNRLANTEIKLAQLEATFATLSAEFEQARSALANDQGVLSRARGKWEGDRASLERTKDALAAALAQIDEIEGRTFE